MENQKYPTVSSVFVWLFTIFAGLNVAGAFVDGWAHTHISKIDTFFTPYHALFYSSFLALEILLFVEIYRNRKLGFPWKKTLPKQYIFALAGVALFSIAGVGDLLWHLIFGIEKGIDALLSPTHMLLSFSGAMVASGPLHAIWYKHGHPDKLPKFPVTLSFAYVFLTIAFMAQFLQPYALPWMAISYVDKIANADYARILGIANVITYSAVFMGMLLSTLRHWKFPSGSFAVILVLNAVAITSMRGENFIFILTALVTGALIDMLYQNMYENLRKPRFLRLFGFLVPVIIFSCYVITNLVIESTWWSVHFVAGSIVIAGLTGLLMTYILLPPESAEA